MSLRHFTVKFLILKNLYFFIKFCSADIKHQNQLSSQFRGRLFQIYFGSLESLVTKNHSHDLPQKWDGPLEMKNYIVNIVDVDAFFETVWPVTDI